MQAAIFREYSLKQSNKWQI